MPVCCIPLQTEPLSTFQDGTFFWPASVENFPKASRSPWAARAILSAVSVIAGQAPAGQRASENGRWPSNPCLKGTGDV